MKKIILLSGVVITTLLSCSTDDNIIMPNENSPKKFKTYENSDFNLLARDSARRDNDSLIMSDPIKPKKD